MPALQDHLDRLTHKLLHQNRGVLVHAEDVLAGTFGAGNFVFSGLVTTKELIASQDGVAPSVWATDWQLTLVGSATGNWTHLLMINAPGALSSTNLQWYLRASKSDKLWSFFGSDGTTAKAFMQFDYPNARIFLEDRPLCLRPWSDTNHYIKYASTWAGQALDGPIIVGLGTVCLADTNNWNFRTTTAGDCYTRRDLVANGWVYSGGNVVAAQNVTGPGVCAMGQMKGYSQNRMHFSTDGNDSHINWDGTYRFWVDATNVKNFVIDHPKDRDRYLIHACLEGPEAAVYYRGQARLENGWVQVDLPDYFESLCAEEGRSVQITAIADDPLDEWCPVLHATYPKNGRFFVGLGSGVVTEDQKFWWEVKAVRKDVGPVKVTPRKQDVVVMGSGPYTYYKEK